MAEEQKAEWAPGWASDLGAFTSATISFPPPFPFHINVGGVQIVLNVDGSWEGNLPEFRKAVAEMKSCDGTTGCLVWLILREMERDARQW